VTFTIADGPRQSSHSRVRVPRDSLPYFTVSDSVLPKPGRPGPRIYISRNSVAQLYPMYWVPFSSPPTTHRKAMDHRKYRSFSYAKRFHGNVCVAQQQVVYQESAALATALSRCFFSSGTCLPGRCLAMDVYSGSTISAFRRHVTLLTAIKLRRIRRVGNQHAFGT
jgi:hypothetical protein